MESYEDPIYTSTNISKIGIKRERLKEWMSQGYVKPSVKGEGPGTKHLFSKRDLYIIGIFKYLIDRGFARQEASNRIDEIRNSVVDLSSLKAIVFYKGKNDTDIYTEFHEDEVNIKLCFDTSKKLNYWKDVLVVNFQDIKDQIDKIVKKTT